MSTISPEKVAEVKLTFMADSRYELPDHEKTSRDYRYKVECDTDTIDAMTIPVPLPGCRTIGEAAAGASTNIQV